MWPTQYAMYSPWECKVQNGKCKTENKASFDYAAKAAAEFILSSSKGSGRYHVFRGPANLDRTFRNSALTRLLTADPQATAGFLSCGRRNMRCIPCPRYRRWSTSLCDRGR